MNEQIKAHWPICEELAVRMSKTRLALMVGADCEDLTQVGLIHVWELLEAGKPVERGHLVNRMKDHIRELGAQVGRSQKRKNDDRWEPNLSWDVLVEQERLREQGPFPEESEG